MTNSCNPLWALALAAAACNPGQTAIRLTVEFPSSLAVDQLRLSAQREYAAAEESRTVPDVPDALISGTTILIAVPDSWDALRVTVRVAGLAQGQVVALGSNTAIVRRTQIQDLLVKLSGQCVSTCAAGQRECVGGGVRSCQAAAETTPGAGQACASWGAPEPCPIDRPHCGNGVCQEVCDDECAVAGQRRCKGTGDWQSCGQDDADVCLDWGRTVSCGPDERCRTSDGQCVPDCVGSTCILCRSGDQEPSAFRCFISHRRVRSIRFGSTSCT